MVVMGGGGHRAPCTQHHNQNYSTCCIHFGKLKTRLFWAAYSAHQSQSPNMTTSQPPSNSSTPPAQQQSPSSALGIKTDTPRWLHYGAWGTAVLGPVVLFMPPRRVGFQAVVIATGTFAAINLLVHDYTGTTLAGRYRDRFSSATASTTSSADSSTSDFLPEKAKRTQELMRRERERREAALPEAERRALQEERERKELASRGIFQRLWLGDAKGDWREERRRKEKEALEEGKGYGDLIVEQVKEVFVGSSKKDGDGSRNENDNTDHKK